MKPSVHTRSKLLLVEWPYLVTLPTLLASWRVEQATVSGGSSVLAFLWVNTLSDRFFNLMQT